MAVDTLYLAEDGREIIAPGNRHGVVVVPGTKQLAWAAHQCDNPDCPGKGKGDRPFLFIWPMPFAFAREDGTVGFRQPQTETDFELLEKFGEMLCPACLKTRNQEEETHQQREQYTRWCRPYVLPESAKRLEQLDAEYRRWLDDVEQRRKRQIKPT